MKEIDPVEQLHKIRRAICKEAGGTPDAYARYYSEMSKKRLASTTVAAKEKPANKQMTKKPIRKTSQCRKPVAP